MGALALLAAAARLGAQGGLDAPVPVGPYLGGAFPAVAPGASGGWATTNAYPLLTFVDPIWIARYPGTNDIIVAEKTGRVHRMPDAATAGPADRSLILDLTAKVQTSEDQGFYSFVFHPEFGRAGSPNRGFVYVCYSERTDLGGYPPNDTFWNVSRFTIPDGSAGVDPASEFVLIHQFDPHRWHQGGAMFFSVAGLLYVTSGDGGRADDYYEYSQRIDYGLFGGVLRIDVDNDPARSRPIRRQPLDDHPDTQSSYTQGYGIPFDNPFVQNPAPPPGTQADRLEEFCAIGLRSPHSMHYDRESGEVWIGDVGQDHREELNRFVVEPAAVFAPGAGPNFQWPFREGTREGPRDEPAVLSGVSTAPVLEYSTAVGRAIIAGFPYRGSRFASELGGRVIYGDHVAGTISVLDPSTLAVTNLLDDFSIGEKIGMSNFFPDADGEVLIPNLAGENTPGGTIHRLVKTGPSIEPPALLSQTGAFLDTPGLVPAPFLVPFEVNAPLWSDRAAKRRWIALPNDGAHDTPAEKIVFDEDGNWTFPPGTVLVKHFELPIHATLPHLTRPLETRFIVCTAGGGRYGVTYRWLPDLSDAVLISNRESLDVPVTDPVGGDHLQTWRFPSRADCLRCHNTVAGQALGVRTHQLNREVHYPATGRTANQLRTWSALGMFDVALSDAQIAGFLRAAPLDDETVPVEHRVRSYLDANCAHCHQPGGSGPSFDARLFTALDGQSIVGAAIEGYFNLGPGGLIVKPGDPTRSAIHARLGQANPDPVAMPPLAKELVDHPAVALVERWINALDPAEFGRARFARLIADSEVNGGPSTSLAELDVLDAAHAPLPTGSVTLVSVDSAEPGRPGIHAIDDDPATFWRTLSNQPHPHTITLDLGSELVVGGFSLQPRTPDAEGRIKDWRFQISSDGDRWIEAAAGTFPDSPATQSVLDLPSTRPVRVMLGGPQDVASGLLRIVIVFGADVTGFAAADLAVEGGEVIALTGGRHYYEAVIEADGPHVTVSLPGGSVTAQAGAGNLAPPPLLARFGVSYSTWMQRRALPSAEGDLLLDPDGDGQVNLVEYLFNLDPLSPARPIFDPAAAPGPDGPSGLPRVRTFTGTDGETYLRIEYPRRRIAADLGFRYVAQFTGDLAGGPAAWTEGVGGVVTLLDAEWESVRSDDPVPVPAGAGRFGRLLLEGP